jgi:hypothetical protein
MTHRIAACLALASLTFVAPRPAAAAVTHTFDTVDAVEIVNGSDTLVVTGILVGQTTPTTLSFYFVGVRCERLAVIAMSKPGKFRFGIGSSGGSGSCKLILQTP